MIAPWILDENLFAIKKSEHHGEGLFALCFFKKGTEFGASIIYKTVAEKYKEFIADQCNPNLKWDFVQTTGVRFVNHSNNPNVELYKSEHEEGVLCTKCIKDICPGEEITFDYRNHLIISEDCSDPEVIKLYAEIIGVSRDELLNYINLNK